MSLKTQRRRKRLKLKFPKIGKRKISKRKITKERDTIWSDRVKMRARGKCEKCGKTLRLQAHHIFSRRYGATRHLLLNGVCLCAGCHLFWAHYKPEEFRDWIVGKIGEESYNFLKWKRGRSGSFVGE